MSPPQVGDIYSIVCRPNRHDLRWGRYHLLVLQFFEAVQYRNETCAARCLVLESGQLYEIYADELHLQGSKVA